MILELLYLAFVTSFVGVIVLGHALLIAPFYGCAREALGRLFNRKPLSGWPSRLAAKAVPQATPVG